MPSPQVEAGAASRRTEADARAARREHGIAAMRRRASAQDVPQHLIDEAEESARGAFQLGDALNGWFGQ